MPPIATDLPCVVFAIRPPMKPIAPDNGRGKGYGGSFCDIIKSVHGLNELRGDSSNLT